MPLRTPPGVGGSPLEQKKLSKNYTLQKKLSLFSDFRIFLKWKNDFWVPETRQEPCRNDKNPLKHWNICKKFRACGASTPYPPTQTSGRTTKHCIVDTCIWVTDSAIIITTSCVWHAVLQLHQLLYRYMTLYITPERTDLRRLVDIMLLRYNVMHLLSEGGK